MPAEQTYARPALRFSAEDMDRANDAWGCNCGPGVIAAVSGRTLEEVRPHLGFFKQKRFMNPTDMKAALNSLRLRWRLALYEDRGPNFGIARVQWDGPWMKPEVHARVRYRHTHWVGYDRRAPTHQVFDVNALDRGGWLSSEEWALQIVPMVIAHGHPRATGRWQFTHSYEVLQ